MGEGVNSPDECMNPSWGWGVGGRNSSNKCMVPSFIGGGGEGDSPDKCMMWYRFLYNGDIELLCMFGE